MAATKKILGSHSRFITQMVASFVDSPTIVTKRLKSKHFGTKYGYDPITVSVDHVRHVMKALDPKVVAAYRSEYLNDFSETPLAFKKSRMIELTKLYKRVDTVPPLQSGENTDYNMAMRAIDKKLMILNQIRQEAGEDVDKLAAALRDFSMVLHSDTYNINIGDLNSKQRGDLDAELGALFGTNGHRQIRPCFSDN